MEHDAAYEIYEPAQEERRLWKYLLFGILTLGIYDLVFWWKLIKDLNRVCCYVEKGDEDGSLNFILYLLLSVLTCGIYPYIWYYVQGNRMKRAAEEYRFQIDETGGTYLVWRLMGILLFGTGPLIAFYLFVFNRFSGLFGYLLWALLGIWMLGVSPLIAFYLFLCNLNKLSKAYNYKIKYRKEKTEEPAGEDQRDNRRGELIDDVPARSGSGNNGSGSRGDMEAYPPAPIAIDEGPVTVSISIGTINCIGGDYKGQRISIQPGERVVIGRSPQSCQIILSDKDISRTHCAVRYSKTESRYYVTDLSTYETTVLNDSERLKKGVDTAVPFGSKLTLGNGRNQFLLQ